MSKDRNKITFRVPIHVSNNEAVEVDSTKMVKFSLEVDGQELWVALHEILTPAFEEPSVVTEPRIEIISRWRGA